MSSQARIRGFPQGGPRIRVDANVLGPPGKPYGVPPGPWTSSLFSLCISSMLQVAREELNRVDANVAENRIPRPTHYMYSITRVGPQYGRLIYFLSGFKNQSNRKLSESVLRVLVEGLLHFSGIYVFCSINVELSEPRRKLWGILDYGIY